jgi:hypothetical protein
MLCRCLPKADDQYPRIKAIFVLEMFTVLIRRPSISKMQALTGGNLLTAANQRQKNIRGSSQNLLHLLYWAHGEQKFSISR